MVKTQEEEAHTLQLLDKLGGGTTKVARHHDGTPFPFAELVCDSLNPLNFKFEKV